jgi:predicted transcriptional regulator
MYTREPDYLAWQLVYGVPTEGPTTGVYVVSSHRHARDPIWNRDVGEFQTESFRLEQFPTGQMTLGQAERLWYEYSRNATDPESPVNVWWGYLYFPPYVKCFSTTDCQDFTGKGRGRILPDAGDWLMLGNRKTYDTLDTRYWQNTVEPFGPQSYVFMMTSPPSFYTKVHWERHAEFTPTDVAGSAAPPPPPGGAAPTPTSADLELAAIVSISAVAVVLATYFLPLLRFLGASVVVAVPGYAKIKRSEVLEKKTRDELVTLVRANPGITTSELVQGVGTGWNTAVYHLRVLEKNGFVSSLVDGRHKRFFPQESINWSDRERTAVLRNERTRQLYETILEEPGVIQGQLAKRAGISLPAVYWHVRRLEGAGLVGHDKLGRRVHYYPSQAAQRAAAAPAAMEVA